MRNETISRKDALEAIKQTWQTYGRIENSNFTTFDLREVEDLLDDLERIMRND